MARISWLKNPEVLYWVEACAAVCGFHGVGWLAAGYLAQGIIRLIAGWMLFFALGLTALFLTSFFGRLLPDPYFLMPGAFLSVLWPAAAIWSGIRLRRRMEQTALPQQG